MKTLITRTITGVVFLVIVIGSLFLPWYVFHLLAAALTFISIDEFCKMMKKKKINVSKIALFIVVGILFGLLAVARLTGFDFPNATNLKCCSYFFLILPIVLIGFIYQKKKPSLHTIPLHFMASVWIIIPFLVMVLLQDFNMPLLLALMIIIYTYDTLAYCAGTIFGKHKLFERISPKKSWEGFIISLIITSIASVSFYFIPFFKVVAFSTIWHWLAFAALVIVSATYGDLFESFIKRSCGVKDSGQLLPGHGGILDRFDSLLFAIPVGAFYSSLFI